MNDRRVSVPSQLTGITSSFRGVRIQAALAIAGAVIGLLFAKHTLAAVFRTYDGGVPNPVEKLIAHSVCEVMEVLFF